MLKGKAPVDPECAYKQGKAHVFFEGKDIYDVMLNQVLARQCLKFFFKNILKHLDELTKQQQQILCHSTSGRRWFQVLQRLAAMGKSGVQG